VTTLTLRAGITSAPNTVQAPASTKCQHLALAQRSLLSFSYRIATFSSFQNICQLPSIIANLGKPLEDPKNTLFYEKPTYTTILPVAYHFPHTLSITQPATQNCNRATSSHQTSQLEECYTSTSWQSSTTAGCRPST
jgi:hypothetical protein